MTTDTTAGYQPPGGEQPRASASGSGYSGSTTESAKEKGTEVVSTATDQAKHVADETKTQARNLLGETQTQVREQAGVQKAKAAGGLRNIGDELRAMADGLSTGQPGIVTDLARQASDKAQDLAGWLDSRQPGDLVEEVRSLARRKPGTFLLGAAVAGVLAGRLTRGTVDAQRGGGPDGADRIDGTEGVNGQAAYEAGPSPSMWAEPSPTAGGERL